MNVNLYNLRRNYKLNQLTKKNITRDPVILFKKWFYEISLNKNYEYNSVSLSTVYNNIPYQRTVLIKYIDFNKFYLSFFTNLNSMKSKHININNNISLLFNWHSLERQVILNGSAHLIQRNVVEKYFKTRPLESQKAACVSSQSQELHSREILENKFKNLQNINNIKCPKYWGGFYVIVNRCEFWQGRESRLHDRFLYLKKDNIWKVKRLYP